MDRTCVFRALYEIAVALGHLGLTSMRERARGIGGELSIQAAAGKGTTLRVRVPLGH
jgi:signal transduction histidine kinase